MKGRKNERKTHLAHSCSQSSKETVSMAALFLPALNNHLIYPAQTKERQV
jgi:hypothetical protein